MHFIVLTSQGLYTNLLLFSDPFNLNHNVGGGVRNLTFQYIMACFVEGRERFGDCDQKIPQNIDLIRYFFEKSTLTSNTDTLKDGYEIMLLLFINSIGFCRILGTNQTDQNGYVFSA